MFQMVFGGRYIVLLMGAFSLFTGMMYNDIFSRALPWFQSGWEFNVPDNHTSGSVIVAEPNGHTYPFGIDYAWHGTDNYLLFTNSYKMKMSVILGVIHMSFGICMVYYNAKFYRKPIDIYAGFIPQMIFMQALFGYLTLMILYKWSVDWFETDAAGHVLRNSPPSLLNTMIYMFLSPGTVAEADRLYPGQVNTFATHYKLEGILHSTISNVNSFRLIVIGICARSFGVDCIHLHPLDVVRQAILSQVGAR